MLYNYVRFIVGWYGQKPGKSVPWIYANLDYSKDPDKVDIHQGWNSENLLLLK